VKLSQFIHFWYWVTQPNLAGFFQRLTDFLKFSGIFISAAGHNSANPDIRLRLGTLAASASEL